jgi:undecaprenyl-diphosphatase
MTYLQSIILGILQGLTEFLPISSSAHLVIAPYLLGWKIQNNYIFPFDVLVQVGSLFALLVYFQLDLRIIITGFIQGIYHKNPLQNPNSRLGWYLIIATIPAGIFGLLFKGIIEQAFSTPRITALSLLVSALLLIVAEQLGQGSRKQDEMTWFDSLWIGLFQVLAVFPGISRSGSTIAGGMTRKLSRNESARFAFLMAIPIMLAAGLLATIDLVNTPEFTQLLPVYMVGFTCSLIVSYLAIRWFLKYLKGHKLYIFAIYCLFLSLLTLLY